MSLGTIVINDIVSIMNNSNTTQLMNIVTQ